jgi:steroid 5-alpha reductase family enzyme
MLVVNAVLLIIYMTLSFRLARAHRRLDTVDTAWGLGFVITAWAVELQQHSPRSLLIAVLVSVWGLRLAYHIWRRNQGREDDPRYRELSRKWRGDFWRRAYFSIFLLQGGLIWLVSLPVVMAAGAELTGLSWLSVAGFVVWSAGFVFEAVADHQLAKFLLAKNRPKVLQTGLWRYSRHPNYFGELTQWWAIGLIALQTNYGWIGLVGPLVLTYLIVFVSGIPPIERRRQKDPEYQAYQRRTSPLIPLPPR